MHFYYSGIFHIFDQKDKGMATLILAKSAIRTLNADYVKVEIPENPKDGTVMKQNWDTIEKSRGILKDKKIDPLEYQNMARDEWNNRL